MTDLQLYLAVGLPIVAVITSLVVSLIQISAIREDIRELRADWKAVLGKVNDLASDVKLLSSDVKLLTGKVLELMEREK